MAKYKQSQDGYIVFEDGGVCPLSYGVSEKWFPTYDEAILYALDVVSKRADQLKENIDYNSVIIYEGAEELLHKSHSCPCGKVVFQWSNYQK